jgi:hypothetical protein
MFEEILNAHRGENRCSATLAAQAHGGAADVMPKPDRGVSQANGDRAAE